MSILLISGGQRARGQKRNGNEERRGRSAEVIDTIGDNDEKGGWALELTKGS